MKRIIQVLILLAFTYSISAQYQVGQRTITFNDPARTGGFGSGGGTGRQIQSEIYYPSTTAGLNSPIANGVFPVIVFGHGFSMAWSAYQNIWEALVSQGYIMVFPRTEGGLSPSHNDFGLDLRICVSRMQLEGSTSTSPFFQHVDSKTAIMGHSMGGGASVLAASGQTNIKTMICLAPAETNPSAIAAGTGVTIPSLVFSGSGDAVTPPANHHTPIFNAIAGTCKTFLSITGGGHCYYANTNFNCDFGETTSGSAISITRLQQQDITQDISSLWLDFHLKSNCNSWESYLDSLNLSGRFTSIHQCTNQTLSLSAVVTNASSGNSNGNIDLSVNGGSSTYSFLWSNGAITEDISNLSSGTYTVTVSDANGCSKIDSFTVSSTSNITIVNLDNLIRVFPNPAEKEFTISAELNTKSIKLINCKGEIIYSEKVEKIENKIVPCEAFEKGIYVLELETEKNYLIRKKIILQ